MDQPSPQTPPPEPSGPEPSGGALIQKPVGYVAVDYPPPPPPEAPTPAAPASPDPYNLELSAQEWQDLGTELAMPDVREHLGPAKQILHEHGGAEMLDIMDDESYGRLGDNPHVIRGLASIGNDVRVYAKDLQTLEAEVITLSQQTGRQFEPVVTPTLEPHQLEQKAQALFERLIPHPETRRAIEASGLFTGAHADQVHAFVERLVRQEHTLVSRLAQLTKVRDGLRAFAPRSTATASQHVTAASPDQADLEQRYGQTVRDYMAARLDGDYHREQALLEESKRLSRQLYGR